MQWAGSDIVVILHNYGICYKGDDGKFYAVKVIKTSSPDKLKSFYNEYNMASKVKSSHAIQYYYLNQHGNNGFPCFIIMKYANGGNLKAVLERRRIASTFFSTEELKEIYLQLIEDMIDVSKVVVHRDIKPENILINYLHTDDISSTDNLILKISDYGISKIEGEDTRTETFKGSGTAKYYAPELWLNTEAHGLNNIKMDMYAMGIVFYEIANLDYPYEIKNDIRDAHVNEHDKPFNPSVDIVFKTIITKMLQKSPKERYEEWREIKEYLLSSSIGWGVRRSKLAENILNNSVAKKEVDEKKALDNSRKAIEKEDAFKHLVYQINDKIYYPLNEIANEVNMDKQNTVLLDKPVLDLGTETLSFNYSIDSRVIKFKFEALHDEPPEELSAKQYPLYTHVNGRPARLRDFDEYEYEFTRQIRGTAPNQPFVYKYYQDKILMWGMVTSDTNIGYNIAILEDKDDPYGKLVMYEYIPNYDRFTYSFPIDRKKLQKIIGGYHDSRHTFRKIEFDFAKIEFLINVMRVIEPNSISDPMENSLGKRW